MLDDRDRERVTAKLHFFKKSSIWPVEFRINPEGWLKNFQPEESDVAVALLDAFTYFAPEVTKKILAAGFHRLSSYVDGRPMSIVERRTRWQVFREQVIVTYPTGEQPGATDSGRSYLRKARNVLGLNERQYMDPSNALAARISSPSRAVLFLDDFAGSGNQFCETWHREYVIEGKRTSFMRAPGAGLMVYLPILSSHVAVKAIARFAPNVLLLPGHILGEEYSAFHPQSLLWPSPEVQSKACKVLQEASDRAGIPLGDGSDPNDWCGYQCLGLAVAIDDTIPDACLTLLYWDANGWCPLFRRP